MPASKPVPLELLPLGGRIDFIVEMLGRLGYTGAHRPSPPVALHGLQGAPEGTAYPLVSALWGAGVSRRAGRWLLVLRGRWRTHIAGRAGNTTLWRGIIAGLWRRLLLAV